MPKKYFLHLELTEARTKIILNKLIQFDELYLISYSISGVVVDGDGFPTENHVKLELDTGNGHLLPLGTNWVSTTQHKLPFFLTAGHTHVDCSPPRLMAVTDTIRFRDCVANLVDESGDDATFSKADFLFLLVDNKS